MTHFFPFFLLFFRALESWSSSYSSPLSVSLTYSLSRFDMATWARHKFRQGLSSSFFSHASFSLSLVRWISLLCSRSFFCRTFAFRQEDQVFPLPPLSISCYSSIILVAESRDELRWMRMIQEKCSNSFFTQVFSFVDLFFFSRARAFRRLSTNPSGLHQLLSLFSTLLRVEMN